MNRPTILGTGAVSPAGWGVAALKAALELPGNVAPKNSVARPPRSRLLDHAVVPAPAARPAWLAHPRLRRAGAISHYTVAAALEALGVASTPTAGDPAMQRLGIVVCVMSGSVTYSRRFYDEVLRNPAVASPVLFPETVFNAPASHLAAVLGSDGINYTLVGDPSAMAQGLALAGSWLLTGQADRVLVVGAEEPDWLTAEAWDLFGRPALASGGAGALLLAMPGNSTPMAVELHQVSEGFTHHGIASRAQALRAARRDLSESTSHAIAVAPARSLLVDGCTGAHRYDAGEAEVWSDWTGSRVSPKRVLGEGFAAGSAWQCVAAVEALRDDRADEAWVSIPGLSLAAACVRFCRAG